MLNTNKKKMLISKFVEKFKQQPEFLVTAPGRVNIIGEHTDYNDGFVLPIAINRATYIVLKPNNSSTINMYSIDFEQQYSFDIENITKSDSMNWVEYAKAVVFALKENGIDKLKGFDCVIHGDVPMGAGLSSSASFELAVAKALSSSSGFKWVPKQMAKICQYAENKWIGVNCGIMDQMISACGEINSAILIDCRSLDLVNVSLPTTARFVILDTSTRRGLVDSQYNQRRQQCELACRTLGVKYLRDISLANLEKYKSKLTSLAYKRSKHVVSENERVIKSIQAIKTNDLLMLGKLMNESHESLKNDFEVSSVALDQIVDISRNQPGCLGARMTGAGFGGCAVALVQDNSVAEFEARVALQYKAQTGLTPKLYITGAEEGTNIALIS